MSKGMSQVIWIVISTITFGAVALGASGVVSGSIGDVGKFQQKQTGLSACEVSYNRMGGGEQFFEQNPNCVQYANQLRTGSDIQGPGDGSSAGAADCEDGMAAKFVESKIPDPDGDSQVVPLDGGDMYSFTAKPCVPTQKLEIWYKEANGTCRNDNVNCWSKAGEKLCNFESCSLDTGNIRPVRSITEGATGYHPYIFKANISSQGDLQPAKIEYKPTHVCDGNLKWLKPDGLLDKGERETFQVVSCVPASKIKMKTFKPQQGAFGPNFLQNPSCDGLCQKSAEVTLESSVITDSGDFRIKAEGYRSGQIAQRGLEKTVLDCEQKRFYVDAVPESDSPADPIENLKGYSSKAMVADQQFNLEGVVCNADDKLDGKVLEFKMSSCIEGSSCSSYRTVGTYTVPAGKDRVRFDTESSFTPDSLSTKFKIEVSLAPESLEDDDYVPPEEFEFDVQPSCGSVISNAVLVRGESRDSTESREYVYSTRSYDLSAEVCRIDGGATGEDVRFLACKGANCEDSEFEEFGRFTCDSGNAYCSGEVELNRDKMPQCGGICNGELRVSVTGFPHSASANYTDQVRFSTNNDPVTDEDLESIEVLQGPGVSVDAEGTPNAIVPKDALFKIKFGQDPTDGPDESLDANLVLDLIGGSEVIKINSGHENVVTRWKEGSKTLTLSLTGDWSNYEDADGNSIQFGDGDDVDLYWWRMDIYDSDSNGRRKSSPKEYNPKRVLKFDSG